MALKPNLEKNTQLWLGLLVIVLSIIYILATLGRTEWISWIAIVFGFFLAGFLFLEGGIFTYFRKSEFKKITFSDFIVWFTVASATLITINTLMLITAVRNVAPAWLISFVQATGVTAGVVAGLLGIFYIFAGRIKD